MPRMERLGRADDVESGTARHFDVDGHQIAVVRIDDDFYGIADCCSHADIPLSEGEVWAEEREIECWKHGSTFSLETGEPQSLPATKPVRLYRIMREGDDLMVELPS